MKKEKSEPKYKYAFNKVFTGSYLIYNLGNELINFIKTDDNGSTFSDKRLVYLNPYGNRSKEAANETKYVLHIMEASYNNENCYELVAISKILEENIDGHIVNKKTLYNKDTIEERDNYKKENIKFKKHFIGDIFNDPKSHLCSFFAEELLEPKENTHIFFKGNADEKYISKKLEDTHTKNGTNDIFIINIKSNLPGGRNLCYSRKNDLDVLDELVKSKKYLESKNDTISLNKIKDEQCLAVICDRTNLEDSMSNQIAYFLNRDKKVLEEFINLLNSKRNKDTKDITWTDNFKIIREHNSIDLLLESDKDIIVIENKIDSNIVEYNKNDKNINKRPKAKDHILHTNEDREKIFKSSDKIFSQLSKYYKYIMEDYEISNKTVEDIKDELKKDGLTIETKSTKKEDLINELKEKPDFIKTINKKEKHFFILKPNYNSINEVVLKKYYNGEKYNIITYAELFEKLSNSKIKYNPCKRKKINTESKFLYDQFIQSLEYVKSSKAEQMRKTAYIRLKQRLKELDNENSNN